MRQKITGIAFLLLCMCLIKGTMSSAATQVAAGSCGEHATWTLDDENVLTIRGKGAITNRSWEDSWEWHRLDDYPSPYEYGYHIEDDDPHFVTVVIEKGITEIGAQVFSNPFIKRVIIPDSVTKIGPWAFEHSSIKRLDIPDSVVKIDSGAFAQCQLLAEVHLPEYLTVIQYHMFYQCTALENVTIPDSVTEIEEQAFDGVKNLKEITFGKNLATIADKEFVDSLSLRKINNYSSTRFLYAQIGVVTKRVTWYADEVSVKDIPPERTVTGKGKKYKIRYTMRGGKAKGILPKSFRYGEKVEFPGEVSKKGYLFVGWSIFHDRGDGWWETLSCDSKGKIYYDGLFVDMSENTYYKVSPNFIKVKILKKKKKTIVQIDCRKLPRVDLALDDIGIRYAKNKKMRNFKIATRSADIKKWRAQFVLPKSFRNRKCYIQFAMVDDEDGSFSDYFQKVGWEIFDRANWFWSKTKKIR